MFAAEHWNVTPDITTLAKGLASGLPISAVLAKKSIMEKWGRGAHASTFAGNPISCAAALATLDLVERELAANARETGAYLLQRLHAIGSRYETVGEVRGIGLMIGVELIRSSRTREPALELCEAVVDRAFRNGLLLLSCGESTVRFMPPLVAKRAEVDEAIQIFEQSLLEALGADCS
jgi:4-aminobutyrate aminotransferase